MASIDNNTLKIVWAVLALVSEIRLAITHVATSLKVTLTELAIAQRQMRDETCLAYTFSLRADILNVRSSLKQLKGVLMRFFVIWLTR